MPELKELSNGCALSIQPLSKRYTALTKQLGRANDPIPATVHKLKVIARVVSALRAEDKKLREGLIDYMTENGCQASSADGYTVSLAHKPKRIVVDNLKELERAYPNYFKPQPSKLDEKSFRKLLEFKRTDAAHLEDEGSTLSIRIEKGINNE